MREGKTMKPDAQRTILVVEDEVAVAEPLAEALEYEGYRPLVASTAAEARAKRAAADLILLDWMLPDEQGIDLLREWRTAGVTTPVIFLTARDDLVDKVVGLEVGADDYMTKPFAPRELLARIRVALRRLPISSSSSGSSSGSGAEVLPRDDRLVSGEIVVDLAQRQVQRAGEAVTLTRMEFELLTVLLQSPGRVFTRDELLALVWGYDASPTTRTVDTHVLQLRTKLRPDLIETIRGVGYRLLGPTEAGGR